MLLGRRPSLTAQMLLRERLEILIARPGHDDAQEVRRQLAFHPSIGIVRERYLSQVGRTVVLSVNGPPL